MTKVEEETGRRGGLLPSLLPPLGIRVHTVNFNDRGALCQVGSDDDRNSHEFLYLLNLMSSRSCFQALEFRCDPRLANFALQRLDFFLHSLVAVMSKDNFVIPVIFVE